MSARFLGRAQTSNSASAKMKILSSFLPFAFGSRDPNFKYNKRVVEGLTGTDCDVSALTVAKFEADIKCAEGDFIPEETMCTLQCTSQVGNVSLCLIL